MELTNKVRLALTYAITKHEGQVRKYLKVPYFYHLLEMLGLVNLTVLNSKDKEILSIIICLHDILEDCPDPDISREEITDMFGASLLDQVEILTCEPRIEGLSRKFRKEVYINRIADKGDYLVHTAKVIDFISNMKDIVITDKKFAKVFYSELVEALPLLTKSDKTVKELAGRMLKHIKDYASFDGGSNDNIWTTFPIHF